MLLCFNEFIVVFSEYCVVFALVGHRINAMVMNCSCHVSVYAPVTVCDDSVA